jgi:hypothetical protein
LFANAEINGDLGHPAAPFNQIQNAPSKLRRVTSPCHIALLHDYGQQNPVIRLRSTWGRPIRLNISSLRIECVLARLESAGHRASPREAATALSGRLERVLLRSYSE